MRALSRAQQLAGNETQLRITIECGYQLLQVIRLEFDVVVQQQDIPRLSGCDGAVDRSGRALVVGQFDAACVQRKRV